MNQMFSNIKFLATAFVAVVLTACHGYVDPATLPQPDPDPDPTPDDKAELVLEADKSSIVGDGEEAVTFRVLFSGDENNGGNGANNGGGTEEALPVGVMRIYADKTVINADGTDCVNITVLYGTEEGNIDISDGPTTRLVYTFNGQQTKLGYGVHSFSTTTPGTYTISATAYRGGNVASENEITITANNSNTSGLNFYHKHLGMQFTSVGCQNCPALSVAIKAVQEAMPGRLVALSFHENFKYEDPMMLPISDKYHNHLGEAGLPRFFLNMRPGDIGAYQKSIERGIEEHTELYPPTCGVAIDTDVVDGKIALKAKITSATSTIYRYDVMVVEDGIEYMQLGVSGDYAHNNVVRLVASSGITGSRFNSGEALEPGREYVAERSITIEDGWNVENLRIVVVALTTPDGGESYVVNNCNECKLGESVDYSYESGAAAVAPFGVTRAEERDVTSEATIKCLTTGETITGNSFTATVAGEYEFEATYKDNTSNIVAITVTENKGDEPEPPVGETKEFERHIAVMEFTGAWCSWCPDGYNLLKMIIDTYNYTDRAHIIALHDNTSGADIMGIPLTNEINKAYGPTNFPGFLIDMRDAGDIGNNSTGIRDALKRSDKEYPAHCGVAVSSTYDDASRSGEVNVKVYSNTVDTYRVALYLLEDGIIYPQKQGSITVDKYCHNHVVRQMLSTSYKGDRMADFVAGEERSKEYTFTLSEEFVAENCSICALVIDSTGYVNNMNVCKLVNDTADYNYAK